MNSKNFNSEIMKNEVNAKIGAMCEKFNISLKKCYGGNFAIKYELKRVFKGEFEDDITLEMYERCCIFRNRIICKNFKISEIFICYAVNKVEVFLERGAWKNKVSGGKNGKI